MDVAKVGARGAAMGRVYPLIAGAAVVFSIIALVVGQVGGSLDPMQVSISEYAVAERGGVTGIAMVVLGLGALALLGGLRAAGAPIKGLPEKLFLVWSGAMIIAPLFPAKALVYAAFVSLPAAAALLVPRFAADERWKAVARPVEWLALAGGFGVLAITYVALPGGGVMIGLVERVLLGAEVALLGVLALRLVQLTWVRSAPVRFASIS